MRASFVSLVGVFALSAAACGTSTIIFEDDCGDQLRPTGVCVDGCGGESLPECIDGQWLCAPSPFCEDCGPLPDIACDDGCGGFTSPLCTEVGWECPPALDCPDPGSQKTAEWSESFGGPDYEFVERVAMDGDGNVYVAASFRDSILVGGGELISTGGYDAIISKYDGKGQRLWTQQVTGAGDELIHGLEVHPEGSLLVLRSSSTANMANPPKAGPAELARLSLADGGLLSTQALGLSLGETGRTHLAVAPGVGTIFLSGPFSDELTFFAGTLTGVGQSDGFLIALDAQGNHLWSRVIGSTGSDYLVGLDADGAGDVFVSGSCYAAVTLDNLTLTPQSGFDGFVVKLSSTGEAQWGAMLRNGGWAQIGDVAAVGDGGAVVTGTFDEGAAKLGANTLPVTAGAEVEAMVGRIGAAGEVIWARAAGPARPPSMPQHKGWHATVDQQGAFMLAGSVLDVSSSGHSTSILLARLDPESGATQWSETYGDTFSDSVGDVAHGEGTLALVGEFFGGMNFGNGNLDGNIQGAGFVALFTTDAPAAL
ncbi:MAG: hypothetical protein KC731_33670 [Myxococcales bacterium]|nr:hypothetical protein [Myxococcales bacterium]